MQGEDNLFLGVAAKVESTAILNDILHKQQDVFDIQASKIENSDGKNVANVYLSIKNRLMSANRTQSDPDSWNQNQRRLFTWFIVCYSYFLQQQNQKITLQTWERLSPDFFNKKPQFLHFQYLNLLKNKSRVVWTPEEDELLIKCTEELQPGKWNAISKKMFYDSGMGLFRTPKHCRERWLNHLDKSKKHGDWTSKEDLIIFEYTLSQGKRWSKIVDLLGATRTQHMIKNRYNSLLSKWRGGKKQKEEDVARRIICTLSKNLAEDVKVQQNCQQQHREQGLVKSQENQQIRILRQSTEDTQKISSQDMVASGEGPVVPRNFTPFGYNYLDYNSFMYFNRMFYNNHYGMYETNKGLNHMFNSSKQSSFSLYKTQPSQ